jgi:hypothetical protein
MTDNKIIDKHIFRVKEFPVDSDKVVFVFTAMGTKIGLYRLFVQMMNKRGYTCIVYDYPLKLIHSGKLEEWKKLFDGLVVDGQKRIEFYKNKGAANFNAYGVSMGTLFANKFTRDTPQISHLILNLTYGDLAQNIWTYRGVRKSKLNLMKQRIDIEKLRAGMEYADPIVNASKLKGRKVLLYLSRKDRVLVFDQTEYTKKAFEAADLDFEYIENKNLGHFLGAAKNLLAIKDIDRFFTK